MVLTYEVKLYPNKRQEAELSRFYLTVTNNPMSTKKEKYMCNQCSRCAVENTAVLGCVDDDCHCHQTESIEWDRRVGQNNVQLKHEKLRTMQKREAQNGVLEEQNEAGRS